MDSNISSSDDQVIEENKAYILGLYDLYQNDKEIEEMLTQKGLTHYQILLILQKTNQDRLEKRLRQARRLLITGLSIATTLWAIYFLMTNLPGADTLMTSNKSGEGILRAYFVIYREFFYYALFIFSCQAIFGIILFIKRKRKWTDFIKSKPEPKPLTIQATKNAT